MTKTPASKNIVPYLSALLYTPWRNSFLVLSRVLGVSHDTLTRRIQVKFRWNAIFIFLLERIGFNKGYVAIDETEIVKMFSLQLPRLSWLKSHSEGRYIFGLHIVLAVWTNGVRTLPIAFKLYIPNSGVTKIDLACELICYCLSIGLKPQAFLFDAFYAAEQVLKLLEQKNQNYASQIAKSRLLDGVPVKKIEKGRPYWEKVGNLRGNIRVKVIKVRRKYFICSRLGDARQKILSAYRLRWRIEEVFRFTKSELGMERCQSRNLQTQMNHIGSCLLLYGLLQDIAVKTRMTVYQIKMQATFKRDFGVRITNMLYARLA
jgi:hypothetical protein